MDVYCSAKKLSDAAGGRLEDFFEALSAGNEDHRKLWERYISYLAAAVNNIHMLSLIHIWSFVSYGVFSIRLLKISVRAMKNNKD